MQLMRRDVDNLDLHCFEACSMISLTFAVSVGLLKVAIEVFKQFRTSLMFPAKVSLGECSNRLVLSVTVSSVTFASSLTKVSHESHRKSLANWKLCAGPELWWLLLQAMPFFQCQKWPYQEETRLHASPASLVSVNCKVFSFKFQQEVLRFSQRYPTSKWNA